VNSNGELTPDPLFEVGYKRLRKVMPMPRAAFLEPVIKVTCGDLLDGDCIAAEIEELVGDESESILIAPRRRKAIGSARVPTRREIGSEWNLVGNPHGIDETPMAGRVGAFAAGTDDPIADLRHFHQIAPARLAEFAVG
jgi:hypothetical protein